MKIKVKLTYFKKSGKYYSDGEFEMDVDDCSRSSGEAGKNVPYIYDVAEKIYYMNTSRKLPGLRGNWDGPIWFITEPECCPMLLLRHVSI